MAAKYLVQVILTGSGKIVGPESSAKDATSDLDKIRSAQHRRVRVEGVSWLAIGGDEVKTASPPLAPQHDQVAEVRLERWRRAGGFGEEGDRAGGRCCWRGDAGARDIG